MSELLVTTRRTVGLRDIPLVFIAPRRLFARVEDVPAWNWPLLLALTAVTLVGFAMVETGLIDQQVDRRVSARIAAAEFMRHDVVERSALREQIERELKQGRFEKLLARIQVIVAEPAKALGGLLLVAALLYGLVALIGRKPEWHTVLTVCVFAGFVDLLRLLTQLALMLHFSTLDVHTSLAPLAARLIGPTANPVALAALSGALTAVDPFRIWFWWIMLVGLSTTAQLPRRQAWAFCLLGWLSGAAVRAALVAATAQAALAAHATGPPT